MESLWTSGSKLTKTNAANVSQGTFQNSSDWQCNTVIQSLSFICCKDIFSDVKFKFPNQPNVPTVPAHKVILAMRSSVFQAMFYGGLCEKKENVEITDIAPDVFKSFLRYLYTDNVSIEHKSVIPLLYTAEKYQMFSLKQQCQDYLEKSIDANNVCEIMNAAEIFNMRTLVNKSASYIAQEAAPVFYSNGFKSLTKNNLNNILSLKNLNASELDLFQACLKWSEQQCIENGIDSNPSNKRDVLGDLLYKIRIPTMTLEDFSKQVVTSGILSELEQLQFFKYFTLQEKGEIITKFLSSARKVCEVEITINNGEFDYIEPYACGNCEDYLEQNIQISVNSQSQRNVPMRQRLNLKNSMVLHLSKIKVSEPIIKTHSCDICKIRPTFTLSTIIDDMDSTGIRGTSARGFLSSPEQWRNRQTGPKRSVQLPWDNFYIATRIQFSNQTTITLSKEFRNCPHVQNRIYQSTNMSGDCQNANVGDVQLQIKSHGTSLVESLFFKI